VDRFAEPPAAASWPVPEHAAEAFAADSSGVAIRCYQWRRRPAQAPALLWGHANGFNAGCYAPFLDLLANRFQVFAFDARGHGVSDKPLRDLRTSYAMDRFGEDLGAVVAAVRARLDPGQRLHYASHSLGGIAALLLEGRLGVAPFASLTLFEPPIYPPEDHPAYERARVSSPLFVNWASRRRELFADRAALREEALAISTFSRFAPEMLEAYVAAAAGPRPEGGLELYCPAVVESAIYAGAPPARVFETAAAVATPAWLFSSDPKTVDPGHVWTPPTIRDVAASMVNGSYRIMPGCRHLMVQEDPAGCAAQVVAHALGD